MYKKVIYFALFYSLNILAMPTHNETLLTLPDNFDPTILENQEIAKALASLQLFKDDKDENLYYYVPPFRILPYKEGAAGGLRNYQLIEDLETARKILDDVKNKTYEKEEWFIGRLNRKLGFIKEEISRTQNNIDGLKSRIIALEEKLSGLVGTDNQKSIDYTTKLIDEKKAELEKESLSLVKKSEELKNEETSFSEAIAQEHIPSQIAFGSAYLRMAGGFFEAKLYTDAEELVEAFGDALATADNAYAGFFSMTIYAGFTKAELNALLKYKKLVPQARIIIMPGSKFAFSSTTDVGIEKDQPKSIKMFSNSTGAGNYTGANIVFDLTAAGARALTLSLDPFIVPLKVSAETTFRLEPFHAELRCNFSNEFSSRGIASSKKGFLFFPDEVTNNISTTSVSNGGPCSLKHISGDPKSAEFEALKKTKAFFDRIQFQEVEMNEMDKRYHVEHVSRELERHQRNNESPSFNPISSYLRLGLGGALIEGLYKLSTRKRYMHYEDTHRLSSHSFNETIYLTKSETQRTDWGVRLCLKYDASVLAYMRCTEFDEKNAVSIIEATENALNKSVCEPGDKITDCRNKRIAEMAKIPSETSLFEQDNLLFK